MFLVISHHHVLPGHNVFRRTEQVAHFRTPPSPYRPLLMSCSSSSCNLWLWLGASGKLWMLQASITIVSTCLGCRLILQRNTLHLKTRMPKAFCASILFLERLYLKMPFGRLRFWKNITLLWYYTVTINCSNTVYYVWSSCTSVSSFSYANTDCWLGED